MQIHYLFIYLFIIVDLCLLFYCIFFSFGLVYFCFVFIAANPHVIVTTLWVVACNCMPYRNVACQLHKNSILLPLENCTTPALCEDVLYMRHV